MNVWIVDVPVEIIEDFHPIAAFEATVNGWVWMENGAET